MSARAAQPPADTATGAAVTGVDLSRFIPIDAPWRGYRWLIGAAILAALLTVFWLSGVFTTPAPGGNAGAYSPALFFSVIIAYAVPIFGYISERTERALEQVSGFLDAESAQIMRWRARLRRKPIRWFVIVLLIGAISGSIHCLLLYDIAAFTSTVPMAAARELALSGGTLLVWLCVTLVVAGLLDNARIVASAARRCRVDLLDTLPLRPFASVAVSSTLAIIGAQAAFPILGLEEDLDPLTYIPGLIATGGPMLLLAALPVWPVHRRIAAAKQRTLAELNARVRALQPDDPARPDPEVLRDLTPLLAYRREVQAVSEWPFDIGVMTRLSLYLIIPPLTWVGAALIENVVEAFL